jgi:hypothetical protein
VQTVGKGTTVIKHLSFAVCALLLSAGAAGAQSAPPKAAIDACLKHANAYNGTPAGTAKFNGSATADVPFFGNGAGGNFRLSIDSGGGGVDVTCTVSPDGKRVAIEPND